MLTGSKEVKDRWKESFAEYNRSGPADTSILQNIPNIPEESDEPTIRVDEVRLAVNHLKKGKSLGYDGIFAEELMATGDLGIKTIHKLCNTIWISGQESVKDVYCYLSLLTFYLS